LSHDQTEPLLQAIETLSLESRKRADEQRAALNTIREDQVAMSDSLCAVSDKVSSVKHALDGTREKCSMSQATRTKHVAIFEFKVVPDSPPMVLMTDTRIDGLVEKLKTARSATDFEKSNEAACRTNSIDGFFSNVADVLRCETINSNKSTSSLTVRVAKFEFTGCTDILIGHQKKLPLLAIEVKPMAGERRLKGEEFTKELFCHQTQIVLQCAALQAQCRNSTNNFSCLLTNLLSLYVVKITSYDASTIRATIFKVLNNEKDIVRAVLRSADDNGTLPPISDELVSGPLTCETANHFDRSRTEPELSGIPQVLAGTSSAGNTVPQLSGNHGVGGTLMSGEDGTLTFERLLPTHKQQKSDIKPNFVRAWIRLNDHRHLQDLGSSANIED
jgi:hypothetical protein